MNTTIEELVQRHGPGIIKTLIYCEHATRMDAEDALVAALIEVLERPRKLSRARLLTLAKWRYWDEFRHWEYCLIDIDARALMGRRGVASNPVESVAAKEIVNIILQSTSPQQRRICHLILDGFNNSEIARELGISRRTVRSHLKRLAERVSPLLGPPDVNIVGHN